VVATQVVPEQAVAVVPVVGHAAQTPPHPLKPVLQDSPQVVPSHVAVPPAEVGHGEQDDVPHDAVLVLAEHCPEHG
jgi:hypothetical protein